MKNLGETGLESDTLIKYNGEPEIGSAIDKKDLIAVMNEMEKFNDERYNHHETIKKFEDIFSKRVGNQYAVSVSSCAVGIDMVLKYLSLNNTDEVLSCAINFHGTHLSIINTGAKLVLVEANQDLNIDVDDLARKITPNTKAIVVTHMNGVSCDMKRIRELIKGTDIKIIEDAARSLGSMYLNSAVGNNSWACVYSFQYKKMITTLGEGGMIVTNDRQLLTALQRYRSFGLGENWGTNYKMTSVQAAMGLSQLKRLDEFVNNRRILARYRTERIRQSLEEFVCPKDDSTYYNSYYLYTILVPSVWKKSYRDELILRLNDIGIKCVIANPPTYQKNEFIRMNCDTSRTVLSEKLGERIICLPIHPSMATVENEFLVEAFIKNAKFINKKYFGGK